MSEQNAILFQYVYVPQYNRLHGDDGGFRLTLMEQGQLRWETRSVTGQITQCFTFILHPEVSVRIRHLIGRSAWWVSSLRKNGQLWFRPDNQAEFVSQILLERVAFTMEDIPQLMNCPFGQLRGHYSRMMYNLLEDISSVFRRSGVTFTLSTFYWDSQMITPTELMPQQTDYNEMISGA